MKRGKVQGRVVRDSDRSDRIGKELFSDAGESATLSLVGAAQNVVCHGDIQRLEPERFRTDPVLLENCCLGSPRGFAGVLRGSRDH